MGRGGFDRYSAVASANFVQVQYNRKPQKKNKKRAHHNKVYQPLDLSAACGLSSPDEVTETKEPSLLRVAGAEWQIAAEDGRWNEDYPSLPARCDEETPLGLSAEQCEQLDALCRSSSIQDERPEMSQAVLIRGLPNELCSPPWMQVVLDQAGYKGQVLDCRCQPGVPSGEALVWLASASLLDHAVWHFHGCCWTKELVTACIVKTAPMPPSSFEMASALTEKVLEVLLAPPEEWVIDCEGRYALAETVMCPVLLPVLAPLALPVVETQQPYVTECVEEPSEITNSTNSSQRLETIWEEEKRCELTSTEVSTESGASGTPVHSETEESHEGDENSDS